MSKSRKSDPSLRTDVPDKQEVSRKGLDVDDLVKRVATVWTNHQTKDLAARHKVGQLLNERFGPPEERQSYGEGVLRRFKEEAGIPASEICRMRWFASLGETVEMIQRDHSTMTTWTAVKRALPGILEAKGHGPSVSRKHAGRQSGTGSVVRLLGKCQAVLKEVSAPLADNEKEELHRQVQRLLDLAVQKFGFQFSEPSAGEKIEEDQIIPAATGKGGSVRSTSKKKAHDVASAVATNA